MKIILAILGMALIPMCSVADESPSLSENIPTSLNWKEFHCHDQTKLHCKNMVDCDEATFRWAICGHPELDGDVDNMPCENVCPHVFNCGKKNNWKL